MLMYYGRIPNTITAVREVLTFYEIATIMKNKLGLGSNQKRTRKLLNKISLAVFFISSKKCCRFYQKTDKKYANL